LKENGVGDTRGTHRRNDKMLTELWFISLERKDALGNVRVDERIILK
jgi:hypothetical protein